MPRSAGVGCVGASPGSQPILEGLSERSQGLLGEALRDPWSVHPLLVNDSHLSGQSFERVRGLRPSPGILSFQEGTDLGKCEDLTPLGYALLCSPLLIENSPHRSSVQDEQPLDLTHWKCPCFWRGDICSSVTVQAHSEVNPQGVCEIVNRSLQGPCRARTVELDHPAVVVENAVADPVQQDGVDIGVAVPLHEEDAFSQRDLTRINSEFSKDGRSGEGGGEGRANEGAGLAARDQKASFGLSSGDENGRMGCADIAMFGMVMEKGDQFAFCTRMKVNMRFINEHDSSRGGEENKGHEIEKLIDPSSRVCKRDILFGKSVSHHHSYHVLPTGVCKDSFDLGQEAAHDRQEFLPSRSFLGLVRVDSLREVASGWIRNIDWVSGSRSLDQALCGQIDETVYCR